VDAAAPSIGAPALDKFKDIWTKMDIPSCAKARSQCLIQGWQWGLRGVGSEFGAAGWDWRSSWDNQCSSGSGDAPLLISRPAMKTMQATLCFGRDSLTMFADELLDSTR
jgi:hypothetical protein